MTFLDRRTQIPWYSTFELHFARLVVFFNTHTSNIGCRNQLEELTRRKNHGANDGCRAELVLWLSVCWSAFARFLARPLADLESLREVGLWQLGIRHECMPVSKRSDLSRYIWVLKILISTPVRSTRVARAGLVSYDPKKMTHQPFSLNNPFGITSRYCSPWLWQVPPKGTPWLSSDRVFIATFDVPTLEAHLEAIKLLSSEEVQDLALRVLPLDRLPLNYLHQLELGDASDDRTTDRTTAYWASCLAWVVTGGTLVLRELQLRSCLATDNNQDSLICAGTESGKTLPIALNLLLVNPAHGSISLTI